MPLPTTFSVATRFAAMIEALCTVVVTGLHSGLPGPLAVRLWDRLTRLAARFAAIGARPLKPRAMPSHPPVRHPEPAEPRPEKPFKTRRLPTAPAWLLRLLPAAEPYAEQLKAMLADPELMALLRAKPSLTRLLHPICRMLGVEPPQPSTPEPPTPEPPTSEPWAPQSPAPQSAIPPGPAHPSPANVVAPSPRPQLA